MAGGKSWSRAGQLPPLCSKGGLAVVFYRNVLSSGNGRSLEKKRENEYCLTHTATAGEDAALISTALIPKLSVSSDLGHTAVQFLHQLRRDAG